MKTTTLTLVLVLIFTFSAYAMEGYVALNYDLMNGTGQGEINLWQDFGDFRIGGQFITDLMAFSMKADLIPAGVPESQTYDLYIDYRLTDKITLQFREGCKHYFSQSGVPYWKDEVYIKTGIKYEF